MTDDQQCRQAAVQLAIQAGCTAATGAAAQELAAVARRIYNFISESQLTSAQAAVQDPSPI